MTTAKQRAWRAKFAQMYGGKKRSRSSRVKRRVVTMARRKSYRRSNGGGFGIGRLLTPKNLMYTVGLAVIAPKLGFSPQIGGAIGGFLGAGPIGAAAGYMVGAPAANAVGGMLGGSSTAAAGSGTMVRG